MKLRYQTEKQLDYLTFSTTNFIPIGDEIGRPKHRKPTIGNYAECHEYDCKMIVQWHSLKPEMKTHVTLSGETCENLRKMGHTDVDIIAWAFSMMNVKIGRIDLNVTSIRMDKGVHELPPQAIHYYAKNGYMKSRLKLNKPVPNTDNVIETCYIGERKKRSKSKLFRAYDKGIERDMGEIANRIIRYELASYKGAYKVAERVLSGQDYGGIIRSFVDFPDVPVWCEIMDSEPTKNLFNSDSTTVEQDRIEANESRWHWLLTQVAKVVGKAMAESEKLIGLNQMMERKRAFDKMIEYYYTQEKSKKID